MGWAICSMERIPGVFYSCALYFVQRKKSCMPLHFVHKNSNPDWKVLFELHPNLWRQGENLNKHKQINSTTPLLLLIQSASEDTPTKKHHNLSSLMVWGGKYAVVFTGNKPIGQLQVNHSDFQNTFEKAQKTGFKPRFALLFNCQESCG